jgi:hypothetical protein
MAFDTFGKSNLKMPLPHSAALIIWDMPYRTLYVYNLLEVMLTPFFLIQPEM